MAFDDARAGAASGLKNSVGRAEAQFYVSMTAAESWLNAGLSSTEGTFQAAAAQESQVHWRACPCDRGC